MYELRYYSRNAISTVVCSKCGKVSFVVMKYHIVLQALSSLQIQRGDLKIYAQIILSEHDKSRIQERLYCEDCIVKERYEKTYYNLT